MTNREAIDAIENHIRQSWEDGYVITMGDEVVDKILEALEKQTPMKPNVTISHDVDWNHCAICGSELDYLEVETNYCPKCGQAIDWNEGEE